MSVFFWPAAGSARVKKSWVCASILAMMHSISSAQAVQVGAAEDTSSSSLESTARRVETLGVTAAALPDTPSPNFTPDDLYTLDAEANADPGVAPFLAHSFKGRVLVRETQAGGAVMYRHTNQECRVDLHTGLLASFRIGSVVFNYPIDDVTLEKLGRQTSYKHATFSQQRGAVTGQTEDWRWFRDTANGNGTPLFEFFGFGIKHYGGSLPGWQLESWIRNSYVDPQGTGATDLGCVTSVPDEPPTPLPPQLHYSQLESCPDFAGPLDTAALSCVTGTFSGITVQGQESKPLQPRQACTISIRPDGLVSARVGGHYSVMQLETSEGADPSIGAQWSSHLWTLKRDGSGVLQQLGSWSAAANESTHAMTMNIDRPVGAPYLTLDARLEDAPDVRCVAVLHPF